MSSGRRSPSSSSGWVLLPPLSSQSGSGTSRCTCAPWPLLGPVSMPCWSRDTRPRTLPYSKTSGGVADLVLYWPTCLSVGVFRYFHQDHHRYLGTEKDKNRELWHTHTPEGVLAGDWQFPKSVPRLLLLLARKAAFVEGVLWIAGGIASMFVGPEFRKNSWLYVVY